MQWFDIDKWTEIYHSLSKHKLRTILTAFGVFWGIFMLVVLLGAGKGMENGVISMFSGYARKTISIWADKTSLTYAGLKPGRYINYTNEDIQVLSKITGVQYVCPRLNMSGDIVVSYKDKNGSFVLKGVNESLTNLEPKTITKGRFLNYFDMKESKKVCVVGECVLDILMPGITDPLNEYLQINGVYFKIIGTFRSIKKDWGAKEDQQSIYIPYTTIQSTFGQINKVHWFSVGIHDAYDSKAVETEIRNTLKQKHKVSPEDKQGIGIWNTDEEFKKFTGLFAAISMFIWIVGIGTIIAGIVGVSNIMMIIVKERTKEIGLRKALGATPFSIISMILTESVVVTLVSGYMGLIAGVGLIEGINYFMVKTQMKSDFFKNPEIDFTIAMSALVLLVVTGMLAGLFPAMKAAHIHPIEALKDE